MTALSMRDTLADAHALISPALDVATEVYTLLPAGVTLSALTVLPVQVLGQIAPPDDATAISWISWISRLPGWRFEQAPVKHSDFLKRPFIGIAAVTEIEGVAVRIWSHIAADVVPALAENGAAAWAPSPSTS